MYTDWHLSVDVPSPPTEKLRKWIASFSNGPLWERSCGLVARLTTLALFGWFVYLIRGGLTSWFDADDLMNLFFSVEGTWAALLKANLMFWSSYYRPAGGLFYRAIYDLWGFHPLPFHIAAFAFVLVDFWLLALIVKRLTGSRWCALIGLLLVGIHGCWGGAYFETPAIYDVLAYAFFWAAFWCYLRVRQAGRIPGWTDLILPVCLFLAALDAKEISVGLPVAVALFELVWHPPGDWKPAALFRWVWNEGRFAGIGALMDLIYIVGKTSGPGSLTRSWPYQPHFSLGAYLASSAHFLGELLYGRVHISDWQMAALLAGMLAVAAVSRRRCLLWATGFAVVSVFPVAFIPIRSGFSYLVPSVGWAVYASGFLELLVDLLARRRRLLRCAAQVLLFAALFRLAAPWHRMSIRMREEAGRNAQIPYRGYYDEIHALIGTPRKGARVLLLSDARTHNGWDIYFLIRYSYGDRSMVIDRKAALDEQHKKVDPNRYDYVLDWENGHFERQ